MRFISIFLLPLLASSCTQETIDTAWTLQKKDKNLEAAEIYKSYADKGDIRAQTELGIIYSDKTIQNFEMAAKYYKMAADQGGAWANYALGTMHEEGKGVEKNTGYAEQRYIKSAERGEILAMDSLVSLYASASSPLSRNESKQQIRRWGTASFERGNWLVATDIARTYNYDSLEYNVWMMAYVEAGEKTNRDMRKIRDSLQTDDSDKRISTLIGTQEIMKKFNHIEKTNSLSWRIK